MNARNLQLFRAVALALAIAIPGVAMPAESLAAFDAFLKLDGIDGESTDDAHKNQIVVESWSFGAASHATASQATSRPCLSDISLVKTVDKASPLLLRAAVSGTHIKEGIIVVRKAGQGQQDYLTVTLQDVMVSSVSQTSSGDATRPMEALSLSFSSLTLSYRPQSDDGSLLPAVQTTSSAKC